MGRYFSLPLLLVCLCPSLGLGEEQGVVRAAFDIGSQNTKLVVVRVDPARMEILEVLYPNGKEDGQIPVPYNEVLRANRNMENRDVCDIIDRGVAAINKLKEFATPFNPVGYVGVGTASFREVGPLGPKVIKELSRRTDVPLELISFAKEGKLEFIAAIKDSCASADRVVTWDIGSLDMQFNMLKPGHQTLEDVLVDELELGAIAFKRKLIKRLGKPGDTPNPLNGEEIDQSIDWVEELASKVPEAFLDKLADPNTVVLGSGGVHRFCVRLQAMKPEDKAYNLGMVERALQKVEGMSDGQIDSPFANTQVSNLILVAGFMEKLRIRQVVPSKAHVGLGVALDNRLWSQIHETDQLAATSSTTGTSATDPCPSTASAAP
ncbi:Ppx/GppA phosphatase family protein [Planctomycetes bacterium Pan216]|uniref:Ppx/GppA phosphatase family protein n=1 Tax=Kolteria novifilia TaxID=2527975 RepID=A0A518BBA3_9BACT|nr:Ppx/GppA phosphatase family protein [Planctomycetes bacterium Pan216]